MLVAVGLIVVVAVVALVLVNPRMEQRKQHAVDATTEAAGSAEILRRDDAASCYGIEKGEEKPRSYGNGSAALTAGSFIFTAVVSGETTVIPISSITSVEVDVSHIIKRAPTLVLKLLWEAPEDGECSGRFKVDDLDSWVTALGGTTASADGA